MMANASSETSPSKDQGNGTPSGVSELGKRKERDEEEQEDRGSRGGSHVPEVE